MPTWNKALIIITIFFFHPTFSFLWGEIHSLINYLYLFSLFAKSYKGGLNVLDILYQSKKIMVSQFLCSFLEYTFFLAVARLTICITSRKMALNYTVEQTDKANYFKGRIFVISPWKLIINSFFSLPYNGNIPPYS